MKIPDISKIDVKDIDFNKLKDTLLERKELAIQVGLGMVSFFIAVSMLTGSQKEIAGFKSQIAAMQGKSQSIEAYKKSQTDIDAFLKGIPLPLTEGQIISLVTDLADKNKVKISTFSPVPPKSENKKLYQETAIQFTLQAGSYKDMVQLVADIENSANRLHVKSCSVQAVAKEGEAQSEETVLNFRIEVASLEVKK